MSDYQVLARKYRPQTFAEVVGQRHIVRTLENAITKKRIAHAYLFVGPRGTGKTTTARIFAKALNCSESKEPTIKPCNKCSNCLEIQAGNSMDVIEIDGASNNGVDHVRDLRETVKYAPSKARFKIIYIDEVHMLTTSAFNALLKTLEEPPEHVKFLFATTDPQKIPLTILSRCQRFDLHRIPNDLIITHLKMIASRENVKIADTALLAIARGASGGMRDAESALDQIIAFCGDRIEEEDVLSIFGLVAHDQISKLTEGILASERASVVTLIKRLADEGKDLSRLLTELISHFRNMLVLQAGADVSGVSTLELEELKRQSTLLPRTRTLRILEILAEVEGQMKWSLSRSILIEVALLKAIETKDEVLLEEVLRRLKARDVSIPSTGREVRLSEDAPSPLPPTQSATRTASRARGSAQTKSPTLEAQTVSAEASSLSIEELWRRLLADLEKTKPMMKTSLMEGRPLSLSDDTLTVGFDPDFGLQMEMVSTDKSREVIQGKLREIMRRAMKLRVVSADDPSVPSGDEPISTGRDSRGKSVTSIDDGKFDGDPLIRKALEIFKGQIVDIRR